MSLQSQATFLEALQPEDCVICYDVLSNPIRTDCGHSFCLPCAQKWFQSSNSCPHCRTTLYEQAAEDQHQPAGPPPAGGDMLSIVMSGLATAPHAGTTEADTVDDNLLMNTAISFIGADLAATPAPVLSAPVSVGYETLVGNTLGATLSLSLARFYHSSDPAARTAYDEIWKGIMQSFCNTLWAFRGQEMDGSRLRKELLRSWEGCRGQEVCLEYPEGYEGKTLGEEIGCLLDVVVNAARRE